MISLEVARLLQASGSVRVVGILLIDSMCPWSEVFRARATVASSHRPVYRPTTSEKTKAKIDRCFDAARSMILSWDRPPAFKPPTAVLIRALEEMVPIDRPGDAETPADIDHSLGWLDYEYLQIELVIKTSGNHFTMFADNRVRTVILILCLLNNWYTAELMLCVRWKD